MISPSLYFPHNLHLCREWALSCSCTHIRPGELPSSNHSSRCWLTGVVEGLSALLKDMSNESEEWLSLAFLPPRPFIILILHSHLFICTHHLHTPSTHPRCPAAVVPPPSPPFPPSLSLLGALSCSISLLFPPPTASIIARVGSDEWLSLISGEEVESSRGDRRKRVVE